MTIILCKDFDFESAQALPQFPEGHKCRNLHGHSFKVTIAVRGPVDEASGIFYDHAAISDAMRPLVEQLDHAYLNDITGLEQSDDREHVALVLGEATSAVAGPLRDHGARDASRALHLSGRVAQRRSWAAATF